MSVIIILILFSILIAGGFLIAFLWAVKSGQMDDKYTPSVRILFDNDEETKINKENNNSNKNVSK
ncbi:MAG: cbb3-type cytochrome oxidase assembly protein CcoS [Ignavibacteria bacterium]|nr:cbb3-type cytochrome oxidase assembly protein CcoS [Ignavibacteria bacterium]